MADRDPIAVLDQLAVALDKRVGDILWDNLTRLRDYLRAKEPLKRRTKGMPYVRRPIRLQGDLIEAGLYSPPSWAELFVGPAGEETSITAKSGGFLALPTDFAKSFRGAAVGPKQYGGLRIFAGIMWGVAGWGGGSFGSGLRQRRAAGEKYGKQSLVPLFILKKSVIIKKRIDPEQLMAWVRPYFFEDLKKSCLLDQL